MRILMLNWRDPKNPLAGGAERVSLAYLKALAGRGHEVFWFAYDFKGAQREETIEGIRVVRGGGKCSAVVRALQWYRRQEKFDLVIDQHHGIPWFAPWWCDTNCVAYIHEVLGPIWRAFYPWPISTVGRWQERWIQRLYRNVQFWAPSETTRKRLLDVGVKNVQVISNGCDTTPLPELEIKHLSPPLQLASVSRVEPNKRIDHAIRTVRCLIERSIETKLKIIGTGQSESSLKRLSLELNLDRQVEFLGPLPEEEKNRQLRQSHFLIHTSIREGWGLNVIEANAMGTPAAVYPVDGLKDSTVDGETGIVAPAERPEVLADCLAGILKKPDKYARLRLNAWNRAKQFQWDRILPEACQWLESQAARRR